MGGRDVRAAAQLKQLRLGLNDGVRCGLNLPVQFGQTQLIEQPATLAKAANDSPDILAHGGAAALAVFASGAKNPDLKVKMFFAFEIDGRTTRQPIGGAVTSGSRGQLTTASQDAPVSSMQRG